MKKETIKNFPVLDPQQRFRMVIKALAREDQLMLSQLSKGHLAQAPQYLARMNLSFALVNLIEVEVASAAAEIRMFEGLVLSLANLLLDLVDALEKQYNLADDESTEAVNSKQEFLDDMTDKLYSMIVQTLGPVWLAFGSVCRSEMELEPEVLLQAWSPDSAAFLEDLGPFLEALDPREDLDRGLETSLRNLWQKYAN